VSLLHTWDLLFVAVGIDKCPKLQPRDREEIPTTS
jgi:hypothetical protein